MNKSVVIFLFERGWTQARIGRKFKVTRGRICQIVSLCKPKPKIRCEICGKLVDKDRFIVSVGRTVFLTCNQCGKDLESSVN